MHNNFQTNFKNYIKNRTIKYIENVSFDKIAENWSGRGIVMPSGGIKYLTNAYLNIRYIREILKSDIPIEIWYLGSNEKIDFLFKLINDLGNITFIDAYNHRESYPFNNLNGWELKIYAIIYSKFEEIIYLDSDCFLFIKPELLFDNKLYTEHKAIFSCDIDVHYQWSGRLIEPDTFIVPKLGIFSDGRWDYSKPNPLWEILDIKEDNLPEFETGFIMVNKKIHSEPLFATLFLNENSHITYKYLYGDKDTFHLAWANSNHQCNMIRSVNRNDTFIEGKLDNEILFQHRVLHSKFYITVSWENHPNRCDFYNKHIFEKYFKELAVNYGNNKFNDLYIDANNFNTLMPGSTHEEALPCINYINNFIKNNNIRSILDVGCGNAAIAEHLLLDNIDYHGIDVSQLAINQAKEKLNTHKFNKIDAVDYHDYENYDLILIKDVFNHLPFKDINTILARSIKAKQFIMIITDIPHEFKDITRAEYRRIDITETHKLDIIDTLTYKSGNVNKKCILIKT